MGGFFYGQSMSEIVNTATIRVVADTEQVEAGLRKVEGAAQSTGKNIESLGRNDRGFKNLSDQIQQTTLKIEAGKRGTAEWFSTMANARGISPERLKPFLDALDSAKRKAEQAAEAQRKLDESTKFLDGLRSRADAIGKTASELLELRAAELGVADAARPMIQRLREAEEAAEGSGSKLGKFGDILGRAKGLLVGLGAGVALAGFAAAVRDSVNSLAELDDMAQKTGSSVESLSKLQKVATVFAADMGQIDSALVKLAKGMVSVDEEGSKTQKALGALGLSARDAAGNLRDPSELMADVAKALQGYQDGAGKAALANDLFGKSGADLLPYLNDLAENYDSMAATSSAAAAAASQLQDRIGLAKLRFNELATELATAALPALNDLAGAFSDVLKEQNSLNNGEGAEWADDLAVGLARVVDVAVLLPRIFSAIAGSFKVVAADIAVLWDATPVNMARKLVQGRNPIEEFKQAVAERDKVLEEANRKYDELWNKPANLFEQAVLKRIAARGTATPPEQEPDKPVLRYGEAVAQATGEVEKHVAALTEKANTVDLAAQALKSALAADREYYASLSKETAEIDRQIKQYEKQIETYGLSASAAIDMEKAKLEAKLAAGPASYAELLALDEQIRKMEKLAELARTKEGLDASKRAADQAAADWKRAAESIEQSLTDALLRGFESGKSFGKNLVDTLKNMFGSLVLRPIVSAVVSPVAGALTGALGLAGTASAATAAAGEGGIVSNAGSVLGGISALSGSFGSGLMSGLSAWGAEGSVMGLLNSGALFGGGIANGLGAIAGALGPIALGIGAAATLFKSAFGRGPKEIQSTTLNGNLGVDGFTGTIDQAWKREGGWFRSDKRGIDSTAVDSAMAKQLGSAYDALKLASADFASVLGINADSVKTRTQSLSIALGKDEEANKKAIADFFTGVGDSIARELLPSVSQFAKEGEGASATLERVATGYALIDSALQSIGKVFGQVGVDSIAARERLIELSGGLDKFAQNTAGFQQNFLTEAERNAPVLKSVTEQLAAMGLSAVDTREEFKAVVLGLDLTTEAGAKQYASLMNIQAAFAQVYPAIDATAQALERVAAAKQFADGLLSGVDSAFSALQRVVDRERGLLQDRIEKEQELIAKHQALSSSLRNALDAMGTPGQELESRQSAQAQIRSALDVVKAGGVLPTADSLRSALSVLTKDSSSLFSSRTDYLRDFYATRASIEDLASLTDEALSVEERSLKHLQDQVDALDKIVANGQEQIDKLNGLDTSQLSLANAVKALANAIGAAMANPIASAGSAINTAYQTHLGRAPDAAGFEWWKNAAANGTPTSQIVDGIANSTEANLRKLYQQVLGRDPDAEGLAFWMKAYGPTMSEAEKADWLKAAEEEANKKRIPGFADGGVFGGGLRVVGERGPELEFTGPSRIISNEVLRRLASPSDNGAALAAEVRLFRETVQLQREALDRIATATEEHRRMFESSTAGGGAMLVEGI